VLFKGENISTMGREGRKDIPHKMSMIFQADESMGAGAFFGRTTMPPGGSFGFHIQKCRPSGDMEIYYIISGKALAYEEDKVEELGPGDCFFCPNGLWNGMENIGDTGLEFLSILLYKNSKD
jgi:mannose-6-phosphate isomerase-like protein (cupin superfamily)